VNFNKIIHSSTYYHNQNISITLKTSFGSISSAIFLILATSVLLPYSLPFLKWHKNGIIHTQFNFFFFEMGSSYVAQAGLELVGSSDLLASVFQRAGTTTMPGFHF
jgi:hypothetical protein